MNLDLPLYYYIGFALTIGHLPVIGKYINVVNTLIHEVAHGLVALIFGGRIHSISLFSDTSGLATTSSRFWIARVLVAYAGYTGSSLVSVGLFVLSSERENYRYGCKNEDGSCVALWRYYEGFRSLIFGKFIHVISFVSKTARR